MWQLAKTTILGSQEEVGRVLGDLGRRLAGLETLYCIGEGEGEEGEEGEGEGEEGKGCDMEEYMQAGMYLRQVDELLKLQHRVGGRSIVQVGCLNG